MKTIPKKLDEVPKVTKNVTDKAEEECDLSKCHLEFGKRWSHCNFDHGLDMEDNIIAKLNNDSTITLIDDFNYEVRNTLRADEICACLCNHTLR